MNTGMQDAFNLAWKLAAVAQGRCGESLLDSYSPERSGVGDEVLKAVGRLTAAATLQNPAAQAVRNLTARLLFGIGPVRRAVADTMTEVSIGYPHSPLNGPGLPGGPRPGERIAPVPGQRPAGSGDAPLFTLLAAPGPAAAALRERFAELLDPEPLPPLQAGTIGLVRPDGYLAAAAKDDGWSAVGDYLGRLAAGRGPR